MKKCIETLLGHKSIESTKFLTSTQKCEAVNRAYQASVPKATTFTRNFTGRVHGTILKLNLGFGDSTVLKANTVGASLTPGSSVIKHILKAEETHKRRKCKSSLLKAKKAR